MHYDDIYTYGCNLYTGATYSRNLTVVYHLVNGCTVLLVFLLHTENSTNDRLKVILLCSTLTMSQTATSNITFSLSFLLFSMGNNTAQPLSG